MEYDQPDLLGGKHPDPAGLDVKPPPPRSWVTWSRLPLSQQVGQCAHCVLVAAAARRAQEPVPPIQIPTWERCGLRGSLTRVCAGHRLLQQAIDPEPPTEE